MSHRRRYRSQDHGRRPLVVGPAQMATILWMNIIDVGWRVSYHAVRFVTGVYVARALLTFPQGLAVVAVAGWRALFDVEGREHARTTAGAVRTAGRGGGSLTTADRNHDRRVHTRMAVTAVGGLLMWSAAQVIAERHGMWPFIVAGVGIATLIGWIGRDRNQPFLDDANSKRKTPTITTELLAEVLSSIGVADLTRALRNSETKLPDPSNLRVRSGRTPNNRGQLIEVELPTGITAEMVMAQSKRVAGGLRRADDQLYLEQAPGGHPGVLMITILDRPASTEAPPQFVIPHPAEVFGPIPVGFRPGGDPVAISLIGQSLLLGGAPNSGKSAALRALATVASWDPAVQLLIAEMKGTGDMSTLRPRCMFYRSGNDPDDLRAVSGMLTWVKDEMRRRQKVIRRVHEKDVRRCPENSITRSLALDPQLDMPVLLVILDEFTELSESPEFADGFGQLIDVARQARALGIILVLGTQRPDSKAIPTRMRDMFTYRAAFRSLSTDANNMILGDGMAARGFDATQISPADQGVCWLRADDGQPQMVRWGLVEPLAVIDEIEQQLRLIEPEVVGHAAGQVSPSGAPVDDDDRRVIDHVLEVWPADVDVMATGDIAVELSKRWDKYLGWTAAKVTRALKSTHQLDTADRRVDGRLRKTLTRSEVAAAAAVDNQENNSHDLVRL